MLLCLFVIEKFSECNLRLFGVTDTPTGFLYPPQQNWVRRLDFSVPMSNWWTLCIESTYMSFFSCSISLFNLSCKQYIAISRERDIMGHSQLDLDVMKKVENGYVVLKKLMLTHFYFVYYGSWVRHYHILLSMRPKGLFFVYANSVFVELAVAGCSLVIICVLRCCDLASSR